MRIAIIQNRLSADGRSKVVSEITKLLNNDFGIRPLILSFTDDDGLDVFSKQWSLKQDSFEHKHLASISSSRSYQYQVIISNFLARKELYDVQLVINSNSCIYFPPHESRALYYFHFPIEAEWKYNPRFRSQRFKLYILPIRIARFLLSKDLGSSILLANSNFTRSCVSECYKVPLDKVLTIYPPAYNELKSVTDTQDTIHESGTTGEVDVISVGAFVPDKMQMEQIHIAQRCPELKFALAGRIWSPSYFRSCQQYVEKADLQNVELFPNIDRTDLMRLLKAARMFLHSKRFEHFGIATVEAISTSCIPIVHNSGGQREIVPLSQLRYETAEDAIQKIRWVFQLSEERRREIVRVLKDHARNNFGAEMFRAKFKEQLVRVLG